MNFSGISRNSLLGQILRLPLRFIPPQIILPILQGKLRGYKWIAGSSNHGCWLGSYEYNKRVLFEDYIKKGSVVYDIGAHVGFYTILSSVLVGSTGKVFAFEPLPYNIAILKKHLVLNRIDNVTIIEAAVSNNTGESFFEISSSSSMGYLSSNGAIKIKTVTIDDLINREVIVYPDYMKIDIEGAEYLALLGAKLTIERTHPIIFLSTHGKKIKENCYNFLTTLNYKLKPIDGLDFDQSSEFIAE